MKQIRSFTGGLIACLLALAMISLALNLHAATAKMGKAEVRKVVGAAKYSVDGGPWMPLKANATLKPGTVIQTGADAIVDLSLNQGDAVVRITPNSTMKIGNLSRIGSGGDADTEAQLSVQSGSILGSVKKLSKASHFDIKTPNGVAGIRGTDFAVTVELLPDGTFKVTFTSVTGELVVAAIVGPDVVTKVLGSTESWTVGEPVIVLDPAKIQALIDQMPIVEKEKLQPPPPAPPTPEFVSPTIGAGGTSSGGIE